MTYQENPNRKVFNVDFDHTLTSDKPGTYSEDPAPYPEMIAAVKKKYMAGHIIIIWSARMWENSPFLVSWLIKHSVPFHGVFMGKGGSDGYVDDKAVAIGDFLNETNNQLSV